MQQARILPQWNGASKKADEKKAAEAKLKAAEDIIAASSGAAAGDGKLSKPTPITTSHSHLVLR